jgi:type I restriction enzyme, S subunit
VELKPGYKRTEVGIVPEEWEIRTIGQMFRLINGCAFKPEDWKNNGTPIIRIQNLNDPFASFNFSQALVPERNRVEFGDLLFAWSGTIGTSFGARVWRGPTGVLNQHIFKVQMDEHQITLPFSLLVFSRVEEDIAKQAHGFKSSFVHIKKSDLVKVSLPVPPIHEQRAIAEALSDVDALLGGLDRLIAKKRDLKQAAMQQLLTGQTRLPGFSRKWEVKRLGDVSDCDPESLGGDTATDFAFKYISLEDVDRGVLRSYSHQLFCNAPSRARRKLRQWDVLVATVRPNLRSHLLFQGGEQNWVCSTGFCVVRCRPGASHPGYVFFHMFGSAVSMQIDSLLTGSNYPAVNSSDVRALQLPFPEFAEQAAIATVLSDMDSELAALEARRDKTRALKQAMMQELLTGRTRLIEPEIEANWETRARKGAA